MLLVLSVVYVVGAVVGHGISVCMFKSVYVWTNERERERREREVPASAVFFLVSGLKTKL